MSNATKIHGTRTIKATATGKRFNQQKDTNWSYLSLGSVARNHTNIKTNIQVLIPNIIA